MNLLFILWMISITLVLLVTGVMSGIFLTVSENSSRGVASPMLEVGLLVIGTLNLLSLIPGLPCVSGGLIAIGSFFIWVGFAGALVIMDELVFLGGLVPDCPLVMVPFIFLVEVISFLIRPVALVLRLAINMTCSHMLLIVGGMLGMSGNMVVIVLVLILECGVALVQSFVFFMILSM